MTYWEERYRAGGTSGHGSYGPLAQFKASVLNAFVAARDVHSVLELGCGDGNQLSLAAYPTYIGFDVSHTAVAACRRRFAGDPGKRFALLSEYGAETAQLALSLDVIYHLVEDETFEQHLAMLFGASEQFVIVFSSDTERTSTIDAPHVRHRRFTDLVRSRFPEWQLESRIPSPRSTADAHESAGRAAAFFLFVKAR